MSHIQTVETDSRSVSRAVIDAVAAVEGIPPTELTPPLYDVVDPEALDNVFAGKASLGKVVFNYNSYEVSVHADGFVALKDHTGKLPSARDLRRPSRATGYVNSMH